MEQREFEFMNDYKFVPTNLKTYKNPKNDNELLFNLQKEYYNGSNNAYKKMWEITYKVARRLIFSYFKKRKIKKSMSDIYDISMDAIEYLLRRFKKNKGYVVTKNWITTINFACIHAIKYTTKAESIVDYIDHDTLIRITNNDNHSKE